MHLDEVARACLDSHIMSLDEDSLDVQIEPPKEEKARIAAHISSW